MSHLLIQQCYAGVVPCTVLALVFLGRNPHPGIRRKTASLLLAAFALLVIPIKGWNAAAWIRVLEPNPSFTLTGLLLVALGSRLSGKGLFRKQDWRTAWIFGAIAGIVLYPMGLGLTRIDPYGWGWGAVLPLITAVISSLLLLRGNRFGALLLIPFAGWVLGLQESTNFWDTLIDPFYAGGSLVAGLIALVKARRPLTSGTRVID